MNERKPFVPKYRQIADDLRRRIAQGELRAGQRLETERELCLRYGVERVTARRALALLQDEALIDKRAGVGSFVAGGAQEERPRASRSLLFAMRQNDNDIRHNTTSCNTKLFFALEGICRRNGWLLSYLATDDGTSLTDVLEEHAVQGVFLVSSYQDQVISELLRLGIPAVMLNHVDPRLLSVMPDNQGMLRQVVAHLAGEGHRRIAYIDGMPDSCNAKERWEAFRAALFLRGLPVDPSLYFVGNWTYEGGREAARQLLGNPERPTAVFAASDMMAVGAMEEFRRQGVPVPDEISVVGYDDLDLDPLLSPPLTSATVDFGHMSEIAFERLIDRIDHGERPQDRYVIRMPAHLVRRGSVRRLT